MDVDRSLITEDSYMSRKTDLAPFVKGQVVRLGAETPMAGCSVGPGRSDLGEYADS